jgi:uncharacterized membrane protein YuzA (DUF378 family)
MAVTNTYENPRAVGAHRSQFGVIDWISMILLIVGGLNWGLVGLGDIDLVATLFGDGSALSRIVYVLVGLAALYSLYMLTKMNRRAD